MKYKTTRKSVVNSSFNIVSAGYCDLHNLLRYRNANAYTSGIYGWNFDVYDICHDNGVLTICTGYRGMPGRRANNIAEYEAKASEINNNYDLPYEQRREAVNTLLMEFCAQA